MAASGALALSFAFSGIPFTLSAKSLTGSNFVQYAVPDKVAMDEAHATAALEPGAAHVVGSSTNINNVATAGGSTYVADTVSQFGSAHIDGLNQQVCAPVPFGAMRVTIAGTGSNTTASHLVIQAPALTASSASFGNIIIGQSLRDGLNREGFGAGGFSDPYGVVSSDPSNPLDPGTQLGASFAQSADTATLANINQIGIGTEAGSFTIDGLKLYAEFVDHC